MVHRRAATHTCRFSTLPRPPGKLVFYAHCEVEPFRTFFAHPSMTLEKCPLANRLYLYGCFPPSSPLHRHCYDRTRGSQNLTCDGEVHLNGATVEGLVEEIGHIVNDSLRSAALQSAATERLAEQNRQIAARNKGMPKGSPAAAAAPLYRGYTQAQYGTSGTAPAGIDCRAALLVA